jgi:LysM repeat protein
MPTSKKMKLLALGISAVLFAELLTVSASAQTSTQSPSASADGSQLQALARKIDEQNAKIDMLSQQILKLQQQLEKARPGVMIGEATPAATTSAPTESSPHPASGGNTYTVARGETLTSIAKMHNVTVSELQKFNHIENDRKLQIGQTIMIPGSPTPSPSASPSPAN